MCAQKGSLWSVLEKLRDKGSSMPERRILLILHGICTGLKAVHERGYAHRYKHSHYLPTVSNMSVYSVKVSG